MEDRTMNASWRTRFGFWLERWTVLRPLLLRYDGEAPRGKRYVNRVNGHLVVLPH